MFFSSSKVSKSLMMLGWSYWLGDMDGRMNERLQGGRKKVSV